MEQAPAPYRITGTLKHKTWGFVAFNCFLFGLDLLIHIHDRMALVSYYGFCTSCPIRCETLPAASCFLHFLSFCFCLLRNGPNNKKLRSGEMQPSSKEKIEDDAKAKLPDMVTADRRVVGITNSKYPGRFEILCEPQKGSSL